MTKRALLLRWSRPIWAFFVVLSVVGILSQGTAFALAVPPVPSDIPVLDTTNTYTPEQRTQLGAVIAAERQHSGNQIGVLMIPSLQGDVLEDYSLKVGRTWGIGTKASNNGVLLLIVKNEHRIRIDVGYGLEGALPDIRAGQIIRDRMAPLFKQSKYFEGTQSGLEGITAAIHNEVDPKLTSQPAKKKAPFPWEFAFILLFIVPSWLASMLARTKSWWAGGVLGGIVGVIISFFVGFLFIGLISIIGLALLGLLFDKIVSANYQNRLANGDSPSWWAGGLFIGGGDDSGDSGGFGGFGGGSFGGGGASGDW